MIVLVMLVAGVLMMMSSARAADEAVALVDTAEVSTLNQGRAVAARNNEAATGINSHYLTQLLSGLLIVIVCIMVLAWFARRMNRFSSTADGSLQILGGLSMGSRERIVLLQVGDRQLLVGVAPGRVSTLHVLEQPVTAMKPAAGNTTFSQHLVEKVQAHLAGKSGGQAG